MTSLRHRMIEDLKIRNYSPRTIEAYVQQVAAFAKFFNKSPEFLEPPHIRQYQVHLIEEKQASWAVFNQTVCALRFFYRTTLQKDWDIQHIPFAKKPTKLPVILSVQEVGQVFAAVENLKCRTALETMYAAGLRVSEIVNLRIGEIAIANWTVDSGAVTAGTYFIKPIEPAPVMGSFLGLDFSGSSIEELHGFARCGLRPHLLESAVLGGLSLSRRQLLLCLD